jgi:N-acetylglucosaminyldiphosphoundecaprenol N-acetyl-beta-D-mannosaminyltransferase
VGEPVFFVVQRYARTVVLSEKLQVRQTLRNRIVVFGSGMDPLTVEETVQEVDRRLNRGQFTQHVVVNVAKVVKMQTDMELSDAVNACDIINIDGAGIVLAARALGFDIPERVAGIDLFERLLEYAERQQRSVFFLGATQPVIEETVRVIKTRYPLLRVAGFHHGYFWEEEHAVVNMIRDSEADLLFVGFSSPMKERFINRWKGELGVLFAMGVGGTFDVVSGKVRRAPMWMQRAGLEWFFRVIQEPRRMWKRYLFTNSRFALMFITRLLRGRRVRNNER